MENIIKELYYGTIDIKNQINVEKSNTNKALHKVIDMEVKLMERLNGEDETLFQEYVEATMDYRSLSNKDTFIVAFRSGAQFVYDMFINKGL